MLRLHIMEAVVWCIASDPALSLAGIVQVSEAESIVVGK